MQGRGSWEQRSVLQHFPCTSLPSLLTPISISTEKALHRAVIGGHVAVVKLLLEQGQADPGLVDTEGRTATSLATDASILALLSSHH